MFTEFLRGTGHGYMQLHGLIIRDDSCWISTKNSLELLELSSINKVSLV
jgi:hypothetical protein